MKIAVFLESYKSGMVFCEESLRHKRIYIVEMSFINLEKGLVHEKSRPSERIKI